MTFLQQSWKDTGNPYKCNQHEKSWHSETWLVFTYFFCVKSFTSTHKIHICIWLFWACLDHHLGIAVHIDCNGSMAVHAGQVKACQLLAVVTGQPGIVSNVCNKIKFNILTNLLFVIMLDSWASSTKIYSICWIATYSFGSFGKSTLTVAWVQGSTRRICYEACMKFIDWCRFCCIIMNDFEFSKQETKVQSFMC